MSTTEVAGNKVAVRQFCDAMNTGDAQEISKTIDALVAPNAVISTPLPLEATGAELLKQAFTSLLRAYPDLRIEVDDVIAEGDKVVARNTVTGTHRGEHMGIAPTGKPVTYDEIFILRFDRPTSPTAARNVAATITLTPGTVISRRISA